MSTKHYKTIQRCTYFRPKTSVIWGKNVIGLKFRIQQLAEQVGWQKNQ